jgi:hypothetical protein
MVAGRVARRRGSTAIGLGSTQGQKAFIGKLPQ